MLQGDVKEILINQPPGLIFNKSKHPQSLSATR